MELRQLSYFLAVATRGQFMRAARDLNVAQPALSQQIRKLELELGDRLLQRHRDGVVLTPAGEALVPHAKTVVAEVARARYDVQSLASELRGRVRFGSMRSLGGIRLPTLLSDFHRRHPGVEIQLQEASSEETLAAVREGGLDLGLVNMTSKRLDRGFGIAELYTEPVVLIVSPEHRLAHRKTVGVNVLKGEDLVVYSQSSAIRAAISAAQSRHGLSIRMPYESGDLMTVRGLVAGGAGIALIPRSAAQMEGPGVAVLTLKPSLGTRTVSLVWSQDSERSAASHAFLEFAREHLVSEAANASTGAL
jgi:LysR family transcriptional regulator, transcription activator of glutamate synthase operon